MEVFKSNFCIELTTALMRAAILSKEIEGSVRITSASLILAVMLETENNVFDYYNDIMHQVVKVDVVDDPYELILKLKQNASFFKKVFNYSKSKKNKLAQEFTEEEKEMKGITEAAFIEYTLNVDKAIGMSLVNCNCAGKENVDIFSFLYALLLLEGTSAKRLLAMNECFDVCTFQNFLLSCGAAEMVSENKFILPVELKKFCTVINDKYKEDDTCDILNRDKEIQKIWSIMGKKTKRNAIIIGEAGVGKSAVVEAITFCIVNETCPNKFIGYKVIEVSLTSMISGTKYRGEFEEKVEKLIKFVERTEKLIVFIDEIHQILGAGSASGGGVDLSGALKPLLARDNAIFIGATTKKEYEKYFSSDTALKRRFEPVEVKEPKVSEVKSMITAKVATLSKFHGVKISEMMIDYAIMSSIAINFNSSNPDKSIDTIDKAMSIAAMNNKKYLRKTEINLVFSENYEKYKNMPYAIKRTTAWHEAGHFVAHMYFKELTNQKLLLASIIPSDGSLGVTCFEETGIIPSTNDKYIEESIGSLLAGRIAQSFVDNNYDTGANSDLQKATYWLINRICEYGMDEDFSNIVLNAFNENSGNSLLTDKNKEKIVENAKKKVNEIYNTTEKFLKSKMEILKLVADMLIKKGIVTYDEVKEKMNGKSI